MKRKIQSIAFLIFCQFIFSPKTLAQADVAVLMQKIQEMEIKISDMGKKHALELRQKLQEWEMKMEEIGKGHALDFNQKIINLRKVTPEMINSGRSFMVVLNLPDNQGRFGSLAPGVSAYYLNFSNGKYTAYGPQRGIPQAALGHAYPGDPKKMEISIWGAVFSFDDDGNVFKKDEPKNYLGKLFF